MSHPPTGRNSQQPPPADPLQGRGADGCGEEATPADPQQGIITSSGPAAPAGPAGPAGPAAEGSSVEGSALDRGSAKACLQRYRRASADIMRLLGSLCPGCPLEKASIDEAYLDITPLAVRRPAAAAAAV
jgi:nucleotidyltransferase/DNA polymerase involved in DNA repair